MYTLTQFMLMTTMVLVVLTAGAALTHKRVELFALEVTHRVACKVINRVSAIIDGIDQAKDEGFEPGRLGLAYYHRALRIEGFWWHLDAKVYKRLTDADDDGTFVEAD
jgi:hypothetical protein